MSQTGLTPQILQQIMQSTQQTTPTSNPLLQAPGQPQASAIPQTSPVQPQGGGMSPGGQVDPNTALAQFQSNPAIAGPNAQLNSISKQESDVQDSLKGLKVPDTGFSPNFDGKGVGGFFHNLGQALLTLGAATRPGQAVQNVIYGPGVRRYNEEKGSLAQQLQTLKDQEDVPKTQLSAASNELAGVGRYNYQQGGLGNKEENT